MTALRFAKFLGYAPRAAPELLADMAAQAAVNVKFYSGDLLPYRTPVVAGNLQRAGVVKSIYPMRTPVSANSFQSESTAIFNATTGWTEERKLIVDEMITQLKDFGLWSKIGVLHVMLAHSAGAAAINWKNPSDPTTLLSAPVSAVFYPNSGYESSVAAMTCTMTTNLVPGLSLNDAHIGTWTMNEVVESSKTIIGGSSGADGTFINARSSGNMQGRVNSTTTSSVATASSVGHSVLSRNNSATVDFYKNGAFLSSPAQVSSVVPAVTLRYFTLTGSVNRVAIGHWGSALTAAEVGLLYSIFTRYMAQVAASVEVTPSDLKWLSWLTDVDVATTTSLNDEEQRIYYTGDGVPKVTNYELAAQGGGPYPVASYDLGIPIPTAPFSASAAAFSSIATASYSRDAGNIATITTASAHGLKTGYYASISDFTSTDGKTFNTSNALVTVLSPTSFSYYSSGASVTAPDATGRVSLAGNSLARTYIYTYVTPWDEESIPSEPTAAVYVREGQTVTLSSLPTSPPSGSNFVHGIRIYRTVTGTTGTTYFRVKTLWFPLAAVEASRLTNVVTLKVSGHHNLLLGDAVMISGVAFGGVPDTSFDVANGTVLEVIDDQTFTYSAVGANKALTATSAGTLYWDASEPESGTTRFYTGSSFVDDFNVAGLSATLDSLDADPPDPSMTGLIAIQNNMLAGFIGNELCFSEINKPWAWPAKYRLVFEYPIVAIAPVGGQVAVMTTKYVYRVSGSSPENMSYDRSDAPYPCISKRGVLNVGYGVIFPSHGGLAVFQSGGGVGFATKVVHDWDTWSAILDPSTLVAAFYAGKYFASHSSGALIFEQDDKTGGFFTDITVNFSAAFYDAIDNRFYYVPDASGTLMEWDPADQPLLPLEWKSKVLLTKGYTNFGAARIVADYATPSADADVINAYNATVAPYNTNIWGQISQLGTINGPVPLDYTHPISSVPLSVSGTLNSFTINGDPFTISLRTLTGVYPVTFKLWANKQLVLDVNIENDQVFRLPTGYRADTVEFAVTGSARIKAVHIAETPYGLREA